MPAPTVADMKTYLGMTGSGDDTIIANAILSAVDQLQRDTGRVFSVASNVTADYSSDGNVLVNIADIPRVDSSRVVTLLGVTVTEGQGYWLLPDRRYPDISTTIQLFMFDMSRGDWYKADPYWWDKNLDRQWLRRGNTPLDLRIVSVQGHPVWRQDVVEQARFLAAWFYWRAKSGASGTIQLPTGEQIDLGAEPLSSPMFVRNWKVSPTVAAVG